VEGDVVSVEGVVSFIVERRPITVAGRTPANHDFGTADEAGIVGEHPYVWELRRNLRAVGEAGRHVLVLGASGTGKELAARAIHQFSMRSNNSLVSRNAATIPASLVEAELFGHAANYPNPTMPARPGLIGMADRGTLFLDEIAELGEAQQANLLRVLDRGEYQRLGEDKSRRSDLRFIAATNRPASSLKPDFVARFSERVETIGLNERRSDVPFLVAHLLRHVIKTDLRVSQSLLELLVRHEYSLHVRELERLLYMSLRRCTGEVLSPCEELLAEVRIASPCAEVTPQAIVEALGANGSMAEAAAALGLSSRYALHRLMKKAGIEKP
jgi:two-component system nitrogen regulation response regulator GlnG/two-component system response regulator HydG